MTLSMFVKDDISILDVQHVAGEDTIVGFQDAAFLKAQNRTFVCVLDVWRLAWSVCDFDIYRACSCRSNRLGEIHRKSDAGEDVFLFREINPMLVAHLRSVDTDIDIQD